MDATETLKMKEAVGKTKERFDEVAARVLDGQGSLTACMVRAYRRGYDSDKLGAVFEALRQLVEDAEKTYEAAIAQPEPRVSMKSRLTL